VQKPCFVFYTVRLSSLMVSSQSAQDKCFNIDTHAQVR